MSNVRDHSSSSLEVESHVRELVRVIEALTSAGLKLKPAKCKFGYEAIGFMGAILSGEKRGVDPYKARVFSEMLRPRGGMSLGSLAGQTLEHTQQTKHNYLKLSVYQSRQEKNSELFIDTSLP